MKNSQSFIPSKKDNEALTLLNHFKSVVEINLLHRDQVRLFLNF